MAGTGSAGYSGGACHVLSLVAEADLIQAGTYPERHLLLHSTYSVDQPVIRVSYIAGVDVSAVYLLPDQEVIRDRVILKRGETKC